MYSMLGQEPSEPGKGGDWKLVSDNSGDPTFLHSGDSLDCPGDELSIEN